MEDCLKSGLRALGFEQELGRCLFSCKSGFQVSDLQLKFHLHAAQKFHPDAVFFSLERGRYYKPQIYIYDFTAVDYDEKVAADLQKKIWSSGIVPLVCLFFRTEIKIIDCTVHTEKEKPVFLETISLVDKVKGVYDSSFAVRIKTGTFWDEQDNAQRFVFKNTSSYQILIQWIKALRGVYCAQLKDDSKMKVVNKLIVQSILIKYLEERKDENGASLFQNKYFREYGGAHSFVEVLKNNDDFIQLLDKLRKDFNGNLFGWNEEEKTILRSLDLSLLIQGLKGYASPDCGDQLSLELIRYYEFSYVPVELISRLYEEFLGEDKHSNGLYYTPAHLARLLVDEAMPLEDYAKIDFDRYKVLDPACGSGIFLVLAFKRLVQWWRLQQKDFSIMPKLADLKRLMSCIYGMDKEEQATRLAAFSLCLALCDELSPLQIITELHFDDLAQQNVLNADFFIREYSEAGSLYQSEGFKNLLSNYQKLERLRFDLIIGNPPFKRSGDLQNVKKDFWHAKMRNEKVAIPSKQIALKFLAKALEFLSPSGKICMILKSSGLLYNTTAAAFRKMLFSHYQVVKILDFTALARNKVLWDNGADVDTLALFLRNDLPDVTRNILHLTFRRTKAIKERIRFDIDDYDCHYVNQHEAVNNPYVWKIDLLGGGRIKAIMDKFSQLPKLRDVLGNDFLFREGEAGAPSLDNSAFVHGAIDLSHVDGGYKEKFKHLEQELFQPPNLLIKENTTLPFALNDAFVPFSNEITGIRSKYASEKELCKVAAYLKRNHVLLQFFVLVASSKALIIRNTAIKKEDIENLPYSDAEMEQMLSEEERRVVHDVLNYQQFFLRNGENAEILKPIPYKKLLEVISDYGTCFSGAINSIFGQEKRFYLSDIVPLFRKSYIAVRFKYGMPSQTVNFVNNSEEVCWEHLTEEEISSSLSVRRMIKVYETNAIILVKPNQHRYWIPLMAYRDADKCVTDLVNAGY